MDLMDLVNRAELTLLFQNFVGFTALEKLPTKYKSTKIVFKHYYPKWNPLSRSGCY